MAGIFVFCLSARIMNGDFASSQDDGSQYNTMYNPHGDSSILLDMDATKCNGRVIVEENHNPMQHISLEQIKQSHMKSLIGPGKGDMSLQ